MRANWRKRCRFHCDYSRSAGRALGVRNPGQRCGQDFSRTLLWRVGVRVKDGLPQTELQKEFETRSRGKSFTEERWQSQLSRNRERSITKESRSALWRARLRLNVPASADAVERFHDEHQRRYGYHHPAGKSNSSPCV